jgi:hypothetical protein
MQEDKVSARECPRCGLFNPSTAGRCDCGYDFATGAVKDAYFKQELPRAFRTFAILVVVLNLVLGAAAIAGGNFSEMAGAIMWVVLIWYLYFRMVAKRNWARITLLVVTFPVGLLLGLSREARLYCLQK